MIYEVIMPSLGADMEEGKLVEWKVKAGDHVQKNQPIAIVETQKAAVEIESFKSGTIQQLVAQPNSIYPVGALIAKMDLDEGEVLIPPSRPHISPAAKKLAEGKNINLSTIQGSGPAGTIELKDIQKAAEGLTSQPKTKIHSNREAIAHSMSRSKSEIPHYYLLSKIHLDPVLRKMDSWNELRTPEARILLPSVFITAVVRALKKHPEMNGYFENNKFNPNEAINIGMVISLKPDGIIVPAILEAQNKKIDEIDNHLKSLIKRSREGGLKNSELTLGTITITNMGDLGSQQVFGIIFPPQVALVGFGQVHQEAHVIENQVKPAYFVDITLSADHRISDGLSGARFLQTIEKFLKEPDSLFGDTL